MNYKPTYEELEQRVRDLEKTEIKRKQAECALRESEEKFRKLYENTPFGIIINKLTKDAHGKPVDFIHLHANPSTSVQLGMSVLDLVGTKATEIADEKTASKFISLYGEVVRTRKPCSFEYYFSHHDRTLQVTAFHLIDDLFITNFTDITDRIKSEEKIKTSLLEKEVLLKEIHHRVKNNLQMIESLLNLQLSEASDETVLSPLQDSKNRIRSMALVHETLCRTGNFALIDIKRYIEELVDPILISMKPSNSNIDITLNIDNILFDIDTTIACGLIINELVLNTLKHAFIDKETGAIKIMMQCDSTDRVTMTIMDNGVGMPPENYYDLQGTLGLQIVKLMAEKQLEAEVHVDCKDGTVFIFSFPLKKGESNVQAK